VGLLFPNLKGSSLIAQCFRGVGGAVTVPWPRCDSPSCDNLHQKSFFPVQRNPQFPFSFLRAIPHQTQNPHLSPQPSNSFPTTPLFFVVHVPATPPRSPAHPLLSFPKRLLSEIFGFFFPLISDADRFAPPPPLEGVHAFFSPVAKFHSPPLLVKCVKNIILSLRTAELFPVLITLDSSTAFQTNPVEIFTFSVPFNDSFSKGRRIPHPPMSRDKSTHLTLLLFRRERVRILVEPFFVLV